MSTVLPEWIDQVPGVDFTPEKELLLSLQQWAEKKGWQVTDGSNLPVELRERTDVLLTDRDGERHLRLAVLHKNRGGGGTVRVDANLYSPFTHRVFELVYQPGAQRWRLEAGTIPLCEDIQEAGWDRLEELAFNQ